MGGMNDAAQSALLFKNQFRQRVDIHVATAIIHGKAEDFKQITQAKAESAVRCPPSELGKNRSVCWLPSRSVGTRVSFQSTSFRQGLPDPEAMDGNTKARQQALYWGLII